MKKNTLSLFLIAFMLTSSFSFTPTASAVDCPSTSNVKLPVFTFGPDEPYNSRNPIFNGFTSNYFTNLGSWAYTMMAFESRSNPRSTNYLSLSYLASTSIQEYAKVNSDLASGALQTGWKNGDYLKSFSNGNYAYSVYQLGFDAVTDSSLQFSNDGTNWKTVDFPTDPFWIQVYGFGNGSFVRFSLSVNIKGCTNSSIFSSNQVTLNGINTTPLTEEAFLNYVDSQGKLTLGEAGYVKGDNLMFQFPNFISQENFKKNFPNWLLSTKASLQDFDWSVGYFNLGNIASGWAQLGSQSNNMNVAGLNPAGCLERGSSSFYQMRLLKDCRLGIYVQSIYRGGEEYARYALIGTVDVRLKSQKAEAEAKAKAEAAKKKTAITCVKGKKVKKITAVKPKCPKGYKKK